MTKGRERAGCDLRDAGGITSPCVHIPGGARRNWPAARPGAFGIATHVEGGMV